LSYRIIDLSLWLWCLNRRFRWFNLYIYIFGYKPCFESRRWLLKIRRYLNRCFIEWFSRWSHIDLIVLSIGSWCASFKSTLRRLWFGSHLDTSFFKTKPTTTSVLSWDGFNEYCWLFICVGWLSSGCTWFETRCKFRHSLMSSWNVIRWGSDNFIHFSISAIVWILSRLAGRYLMYSAVRRIWLGFKHKFLRIWFSPFVLSTFAIQWCW
jgi:hypothetical protein